jgi:hypothetical protein
MKRILIFIFVFALVTSASAEISKVGSSGAQFLKIGIGSRYQAMGEASAATVNDVYAMFWNPAGLASIENGSVGFTNVNYVLDLNLNFFGLAKNFENIGVIGVSTTVLSADNQEITTFDQQDGTGQSYSVSSYTFGITYARMLTARLAFGGTLKYIGERIHLENANGFAFDFGTMLFTGFRSLRMGMSITNMGDNMKFQGPNLSILNASIPAELKTSPYELPMSFRFGLAYDFPIGSKTNLMVASDLKHLNDNYEQGSIGAEFSYAERYFLRGGYKINCSEEGLALGGGLRTTLSRDTKLVLDYSWQDLGRLESSQRFSVGITF